MLTRRTFLKAGACALVALGSVPRFLVRAAHATTGPGKVLVAVFQRGAVDGLGMVVPHGDPAYFVARQSIALQRPKRGESQRALDLDGFFAFHPALAPLIPLWEKGTLAVVHAC
ncbi:MAG: twin-arginine translocation signal domain-containing protein, partial [Chloroflexota bacterium]